MRLICPHCRHAVDYSNERPRFCSFCGEGLSSSGGTPPEEIPTRTAAPAVERTQDFAAPTEDPGPSRPRAVVSTPSFIGSYRLMRRLGGGGMGNVYEAEHTDTGQRVAIKLINPEFVSSQAVERFRMEGRLASAISHPRCVFVLAADEEAGQPYIVMELMPGSTLTDLVSQRGPLPVQEAIEKILDVIDGLHEAHRLGVIHRDVKPSNCFLDVDSRVKVGDFGLAKMQSDSGDITRTGGFVGTVLFASPEQIKRQPLDQQADVYSVAATLYFLLTGQAPFSDIDALAATARIVSEDAPPMRTLRAGLPKGLDDVVLRGLAREKSKRWPDLASFRDALSDFLPSHLSSAGLGYRFGALAVDALVLFLAKTFLSVAIVGVSQPTTGGEFNNLLMHSLWIQLVWVLGLWIPYFFFFEWRFGCTIGKWMFRLRVTESHGSGRPRFARALLRATAFTLMTQFDDYLAIGMAFAFFDLGVSTADTAIDLTLPGIILICQVAGSLLNALVPMFTMRKSNGYRGLHEFISGSRIVQVPDHATGPNFRSVSYVVQTTSPEGMPKKLGTLAIDGAIRWKENEKILLGHDLALGRLVWIWLWPGEGGEMAPTRRELTRPARLRWVASGLEDRWHWEAFLAPIGAPLREAVQQTGPLPWSACLPILSQLTEELAAGTRDGTLPPGLSVDNIFVDEVGRVQILGSAPPITGAPPDRRTPGEIAAEAAVTMLEGQPRPIGASDVLKAPIPRHAANVINRMSSETDVDRLNQDVRSLASLPTRVNRPRRFLQIILLGFLAAVPFSCAWSTLLFGPTMMSMGIAQQLHNERRYFDFASQVDLAAGLIQPDLIARLRAAHVFAGDQELLRSLDARIEHSDRRFEARLRASHPLVRRAVAQQQGIKITTAPNKPFYNRFSRTTVRSLVESDTVHLAMARFDVVLGVFVLFGLPAAWILWGFITRGGVILYVLRMQLVRRDGRKAGFFACLLRGVLFWGPLVLLWGTSIWLDRTYWSGWDVPALAAQTWKLWISWITWWTGLILLLVYLALAIWRPERNWYDRALGLWIVPR